MPRPAEQSVIALVKNAPRPTLAARGRLIGIGELQKILPPFRGKPRTRWWFNHSFLPEKRVRIGRDSAWWESDVIDYLDSTMEAVAS